MSEPTESYSVISIECGLGIDPPALYCPRTGKLVFASGEDLVEPDSPYVTFIHHNECGFLFLREDIRCRLDEARQEIAAADPEEYESVDDVYEDLDTLLEHVSIGNVSLIYEIVSKSMACGPVTSTLHIGFDVWPEDEQEGVDQEEEDEEAGDD